jgi:hypothetical protein
MSVAYAILAHRGPAQLGRLVRALGPGEPPVLLHVDARTPDETWRAMRRELAGRPGVTWLERRRCRWGGWGTTAAALDAIGIVARGEVDAGHLALLSGQDYPVKPDDHVRRFLAEHRGISFLDAAPLGPAGSGGYRGAADLSRLERWWFYLAGRHRSLPTRRTPPGGLRGHGGLGFWCLARPAAEHVHRWFAEHPEGERFFRHTAVPDETVVHTVLWSSELAPTLRAQAVHWVDFPPGSARPRTLTADDLPTLEHLPPSGLFARKFDPEVDRAVLDALDALRARG